MSACRELTMAELRSLLAACRGRNGLRDRTYLLLATTTGFRVSEMLKLRRKDVVDYRGQVARELTVARKDMKKKREGRTVPLAEPMRLALLAWLVEMEERGAARAEDPLFPNGWTGRSLGRSAAWKMIRRRAKAARLDVRRLGTHSTRKTFASEIQTHCRETGDAELMRKAQEALGHAEITSTTKYLRSLTASERSESFQVVAGAVFGSGDGR